MSDITIPRELAERISEEPYGHNADLPDEHCALCELLNRIRTQLHPQPEPRVGDVKKRDGWLFVRGLYPEGVKETWYAVTARDFSRTDEQMREYPTIFNILDELDAREKGPTVHLTEEVADYVQGMDADTPPHLPDWQNTIAKALAVYRESQKETK